MKTKKEYNIIFKFSDVVQTIEAESEEEAQQKGWDILAEDINFIESINCYEIEIEEIEE